MDNDYSVADGRNLLILAQAEDQIKGFHRHPFTELSKRCSISEQEVMERLAGMLRVGTIRRVRQTLLATSLAQGALVAWKLPEEKLLAAYDWLMAHDPFSGHVVLRSCDDTTAAGADYRLWTTLKVPTGYGSIDEHCRILMRYIGALDFVPLPTVGMFALSVGHVRRAKLQLGDKLPQAALMDCPTSPTLSQREWDVLLALKESLKPEEFVHETWALRAEALDMPLEDFCEIAQQLDEKQVIGRFATFLDVAARGGRHGGSRSGGLFHWTVPAGMEERAGGECGRHICMTHCYWRSNGAAFGGAQIMGVVHGNSREDVLAHKATIDAHLLACEIPLLHTAVFWSNRSEVRPSEIRPDLYLGWLSIYS